MLPINRLNPFRFYCMTIGELPSSYVETMTYAELLTWFCNYLENKVIPAVNNNAQALKEVQDLVLEIKNYVETYFDSPEFLQDVSNKLDEMAEDGTLDQIINTNITGTLSNLNTTDKSNLVSAINEVNDNIGDLSDLETTVKTDVVSAINDLNKKGYIFPTLNLSGCSHLISSVLQFPQGNLNTDLNNALYCKLPNTWVIAPDLGKTLNGATWSLVVDGEDVTDTCVAYSTSNDWLRMDIICPANSVVITVTAVDD